MEEIGLSKMPTKDILLVGIGDRECLHHAMCNNWSLRFVCPGCEPDCEGVGVKIMEELWNFKTIVVGKSNKLVLS